MGYAIANAIGQHPNDRESRSTSPRRRASRSSSAGTRSSSPRRPSATGSPAHYQGISLWGHFPESLTLGSKLGQMGRGLASLARKEYTVGATMNARTPLFDVVIVGLGPTGLTLAHGLGKRGHRVLVLEREPKFYGNARAVYTDGECMRIFQSFGMAERLAADMLQDAPVQMVLPDGRVLFQLKNTHGRTAGRRTTSSTSRCSRPRSPRGSRSTRT